MQHLREKKKKKRGSNTLLWWFMSCNTAAIKYMLLITHQHCTRFITNHEQISWRLCCCDLNIPLINFIDKSNCSLNSVLLTHAEDNCKQSIYCPGGPKRTKGKDGLFETFFNTFPFSFIRLLLALLLKVRPTIMCRKIQLKDIGCGKL